MPPGHIENFCRKIIFSEKFKSVPNASLGTHKARNDLRAAVKKWWLRLVGKGRIGHSQHGLLLHQGLASSNGNLGFPPRIAHRSHRIPLA